MKVLLVHPRIPNFTPYNRLFPLGMSYVSAYCSQQLDDVEIMVYDQQYDDTQTLDDVLNKFTPNVVGVYSVSRAFNAAVEIARYVKSINESIYLVAGGPHPTALPELTLSKGFDVVARGEAEETFTELIFALQTGGDIGLVNGISFIDSTGKIIHTPKRKITVQLDDLPMPFRNLNPEMYQHRLVNVSSSRGCPSRCAFCYNSGVIKHNFRVRSSKNFIDELELLYETHDVNRFYLVDEHFTSIPKRTVEICDLIIERGLDISWYTYSRVDTISLGLLEKMKLAGCRSIEFGIESGSQKILDRINKRASLKAAAKAIELCKKVGIRSTTDWIVGLPGDMDEQLKSVDFMKAIQPDQIEVYLSSVFPGTALWDNAEDYGIHIDRESIDWDQDLEVTEFDLDYMNHSQIYEVAEKMTSEMRKLGYVTGAEQASTNASDDKVIYTFLERGLEKEQRVLIDTPENSELNTRDLCWY